MINGNVSIETEIVDLTDDFNAILDEYITLDGGIVIDLDAWTTTDLLAVLDIFQDAMAIRAEDNESITSGQ